MKKTEVAALMTTGPELSMTREKIDHNAQGVPGGCIYRHAFAALLETKPRHNLNGPLIAPIDLYHSRGDWKTGAVTFKVVRTRIQYRPFRPYETPGSWCTVAAYEQR